MKLFVKILIAIALLAVGALCYCVWVFHELAVDLENNIRTQPMRDARWKRKSVVQEPEEEEPLKPPDETIQIKSGDSESKADDKNLNQ